MKHGAGGMAREVQANAYKAAQQMLAAFQSVGAENFDLTITTLTEEKIEFRRNVPLESLLRRLHGLLPAAEQQLKNLIVRPVSRGAMLVQLDDLRSDAELDRVKLVAFLVFATSPGNHQAWVAVSDSSDKNFARRLKKGVGADPTASSATRLAGSVNFKPKYMPNYPRVSIVQCIAGRTVTVQELTQRGLVAEPERPPRVSSLHQSRPGRRRILPDYQRCVDSAPRNHGNTGPDISRADFTFARTALGWGCSEEQVIARLLEVSSKAKEAGQGERYVELTVENAAQSLERDIERSISPEMPDAAPQARVFRMEPKKGLPT
jgi:hypothetical protein